MEHGRSGRHPGQHVALGGWGLELHHAALFYPIGILGLRVFKVEMKIRCFQRGLLI